MAVEVHIEKDADYYVEAFTKDYRVNEDRTEEDFIITRLAYVAGFRDYDMGDEEQLKTWLDLRNKIKEAYEAYPDGEVTVKLVVKDEWVNV
jgi:outer membrane lipoprotein-sorting protein